MVPDSGSGEWFRRVLPRRVCVGVPSPLKRRIPRAYRSEGMRRTHAQGYTVLTRPRGLSADRLLWVSGLQGHLRMQGCETHKVDSFASRFLQPQHECTTSRGPVHLYRGTSDKTGKAGFWPWFLRPKSLNRFSFIPLRSAAVRAQLKTRHAEPLEGDMIVFRESPRATRMSVLIRK